MSAIVSHKVISLLFSVGLLCVVLPTALAWRLAQGPIDLSFLAGQLEAAVNTEGAPTRISIGGIALAWEGFNHGLDSPVDLRLRDVTVTDDTGRKHLEVPRAAVTFAPRGLLLGRLLPSELALDGVRLTLLRAADGSVSADVGSLSESMDTPQQTPGASGAALSDLFRPLAAEASGQSPILSLLRRVRLSDIGIQVRDGVLGTTWQVPRLDIDLIRRRGGGIDLSGEAALLLGDQTAHLTLTAASSADHETILARFGLTQIVPAAVAGAAGEWAGLAALDAPVSLRGEVRLSQTLTPEAGTLTLSVGSGSVRVNTGTLPLRSAEITIEGTPDRLTIDRARVVLPGFDGRPDSTVTANGSVHRGPQRLTAAVDLTLDQIDLADLPRLWPAGVGGGGRFWVLGNITGGIARNGHGAFSLEANADLSDLTLTKATGTVDGDDLTIHWFRPVPPVEQARAQLRLTDPDTLDITFSTGRQRTGAQQHTGAQASIMVTGGTMRITGLSVKDQDTEIAVQLFGSLADTIALLKEPRLRLLSTHPMDLRDPAGDATIAVKIKLPLESKLDIEDVDVAVSAQLRRGHLSGVAAGRDLDQADLDIVADKKSLTLKGTGLLAGIPAKIDGLMDFQSHKPKDVQQRIAVTATPSAGQLATAGLNMGGVMAGDIPLQAVWSKRADGEGDIAITADLGAATLSVAPLAWHKPAGVAARASARLLLSKDHFVGIGAITADGPGLTLRGSAETTNGDISAVRLDRVVLGRTDLTGVIRLPARGPIDVELSGPVLDVAAKLAEKTPKRDKSKLEPPPSPSWNLTGTFGQVLLANGKSARSVSATMNHDGRVFRALSVRGAIEPSAPFSIDIAMDRGIRRIEVRANDAGALLQGMDATQSLDGGQLTLTGSFDDTNPAHPLSALAEVVEFRVHGALALGKLLQAMTLYGLVDVVRGPGLVFARLTAPLVLEDDVLTLTDARAFSQSLGITVKGQIDLNAGTLDLEGTIVPAYFFNSLLGRIPFVGGLFSAEKGGGLFAARYTLRGSAADPSVFVNPLSVLTPGFLRGVFGIF